MRGADLSRGNFRGCNFIKADLSRANLHMADFTGANLTGADMSMAYAKGALFVDAKLCTTVMRRMVAKNALFINADMTMADVAFAEFLGAKFDGAITEQLRNVNTCSFRWWMSPHGGYPSYVPVPGWALLEESVLGNISFRENAARQKLELHED